MSTTPIVPNLASVCKHLHTKRPFNDHTLVCEDCKKDITGMQDAPATPAPKPAATPVVVPTA